MIKRRVWTAEEEAVLHQHYSTLGPIATAALLPGRTCPAIKARAFKLALTTRHRANESVLAAATDCLLLDCDLGQLLKATGVSRAELASRTGYSQSGISRAAAGRNLHLRTAIDLLQAAGFDLVLRRREP